MHFKPIVSEDIHPNPTVTKHKVSRVNSQEHVTRWQESNLTQAAYCRDHGINPKTFANWIKREERASCLPSKQSTTCTPNLAPTEVQVCCHFSNGHDIQIKGALSMVHIKQLILELSTCKSN